MAIWIQCTDLKGQKLYVNLDNAITLFRDDVGRNGTAILFMESEQVVKETPEELLQKAAQVQGAGAKVDQKNQQ